MVYDFLVSLFNSVLVIDEIRNDFYFHVFASRMRSAYIGGALAIDGGIETLLEFRLALKQSPVIELSVGFRSPKETTPTCTYYFIATTEVDTRF